VEALIDLYLLAECDYLILDTSSSFSYVARLLASAPARHIVDVSRGQKGFPQVRRLMWRVWLRMGLFTWGLSALRRWTRLRQRSRGEWRRGA
jgi:hypothetical protein